MPLPRHAARLARLARLARWATTFALAAASVATAQAATFDLVLTPHVDGRTRMAFSAAGSTEGLAAGSDLSWANLIGGDPFDDALQFFDVAIDPIQTFSGISLIGLTLDSDGDIPGGQDDLTLRFDGLVSSDDNLTTGEVVRLLDLDFALLTPGTYTRVTSAGELNLTIGASPVPMPASAHLLLGGLALLAGAVRCRRVGDRTVR